MRSSPENLKTSNDATSLSYSVLTVSRCCAIFFTNFFLLIYTHFSNHHHHRFILSSLNHPLKSRFFGGGPMEEEEKVVKGDDVIVDPDATLEDLYIGGSLKVWREEYVLKPTPGKRR